MQQPSGLHQIRFYAPFRAPGRVSWQNALSGAYGFNLRLDSGWLAKAETAFAPKREALSAIPTALKPLPGLTAQPARLYNGMIAPLVPYGIAGVLWYQGETNVGRAAQYRTAFPLLIEDWRAQWGQPELPFYFCQLPNFDSKRDEPVESEWAELREAQSMALRLPHTGQAVLIDAGEAENVHPGNKRTVGWRLAQLALAGNYGQSDRIATGPAYVDKSVEGGRIYLRFKDESTGSELVARPLGDTYLRRSHPSLLSAPLKLPSPASDLQGFAVYGSDGNWVWANAKIEDSHTVVVWADAVPEPVHVRYAWAHNPTCNLYNAVGLPASPFRTDDFPLRTANARY